MARTMTENCIGGLGRFGGLFELDCSGMGKPGSDFRHGRRRHQLRIAMLLDKHDTIGIDCVAMCVNDVIAAAPLLFFLLDYIACGRNQPSHVAEIVYGVRPKAAGRPADPFVGGETAGTPV